MAENKTQPTGASVKAFLAAVPQARRREESLIVATMMRKATRAPARMWGPTIVGFGRYRYTYASGRTGVAPLTGFSPRKDALTLYILGGFDIYDGLVRQLGRCRTGKACLYIKSLDDVDLKVLQKLITASVEHMRRLHPLP